MTPTIDPSERLSCRLYREALKGGRLKRYAFAILMILLMSITIWRYAEIIDFEARSKEHSFVVSGDLADVSAMKADLQNITRQPVEDEFMTDGSYRLTFRCPPEKVGSVWSRLEKFNLKKQPSDP
jgi:hypothetical protein